jgi:hypothetical protein
MRLSRFGTGSAIHLLSNDPQTQDGKPMSQAAVEKTLGKLITDECFRRRFFKDPAATTFAAGLELSRAELDALSRLSMKLIARFSARLDHRICRLPLEEEKLEEEEGRHVSPGTPQVRRGRTGDQ